MDTTSSAEFRKTYAKLTQPTAVTVNGHRIGLWLPVVDGIVTVKDTFFIPTPQDVTDVTPEFLDRHFNSRPFTPVPKKGK